MSTSFEAAGVASAETGIAGPTGSSADPAVAGPTGSSSGTTAATRPAEPVLSADGPAPETPTERAIAPLSSLTSLLGGDVAGGQACAADGTCD